MNKIILILFLFFLTGCSEPPTNNIIKPSIKTSNQKITCLQKAFVNSNIFKSQFKYDDSYPPTITVYIKGSWNKLNDDQQDNELKKIGKKWQECNSDNNSPLTIIAYDSNDIPVKAIFLTR